MLFGYFPWCKRKYLALRRNETGLGGEIPANIERPFDFSLPMGYTKSKGGKGPWTG